MFFSIWVLEGDLGCILGLGGVLYFVWGVYAHNQGFFIFHFFYFFSESCWGVRGAIWVFSVRFLHGASRSPLCLASHFPCFWKSPVGQVSTHSLDDPNPPKLRRSDLLTCFPPGYMLEASKSYSSACRRSLSDKSSLDALEASFSIQEWL